LGRDRNWYSILFAGLKSPFPNGFHDSHIKAGLQGPQDAYFAR
jgi:hypothetical protein